MVLREYEALSRALGQPVEDRRYPHRLYHDEGTSYQLRFTPWQLAHLEAFLWHHSTEWRETFRGATRKICEWKASIRLSRQVTPEIGLESNRIESNEKRVKNFFSQRLLNNDFVNLPGNVWNPLENGERVSIHSHFSRWICRFSSARSTRIRRSSRKSFPSWFSTIWTHVRRKTRSNVFWFSSSEWRRNNGRILWDWNRNPFGNSPRETPKSFVICSATTTDGTSRRCSTSFFPTDSSPQRWPRKCIDRSFPRSHRCSTSMVSWTSSPNVRRFFSRRSITLNWSRRFSSPSTFSPQVVSNWSEFFFNRFSAIERLWPNFSLDFWNIGTFSTSLPRRSIERSSSIFSPSPSRITTPNRLRWRSVVPNISHALGRLSADLEWTPSTHLGLYVSLWKERKLDALGLPLRRSGVETLQHHHRYQSDSLSNIEVGTSDGSVGWTNGEQIDSLLSRHTTTTSEWSAAKIKWRNTSL